MFTSPLQTVALLLAVGVLLPLQANAGPGVAVSSRDGVVTATVRVSASADRVMELLVEPSSGARLSEQVLSVEVLEPGDCDLVLVTTAGLVRPFTYVGRRCLTDLAIDERMISSDDYLAQRSRWSVRPLDDGSEVTFEVESRLRGVPDRLVRKVSRSKTRKMLEELRRVIDG